MKEMNQKKKQVSPYFSLFPVSDIEGLYPSSWLCVGEPFSREEVKSLLFNQGVRSFLSDAVTTPSELAWKVLNQKEKRFLDAHTRAELLKTLLREDAISARCPQLKKMMRQAHFFKHLDHSLQKACSSFVHWGEEAVMSEFLEAKGLKSPVRQELRVLRIAFEGWLESQELWDAPMLFKKACFFLEEGKKPQNLEIQNIYLLSGSLSALEDYFLKELSRVWQIELIELESLYKIQHQKLKRETNVGLPRLVGERWHTLEDSIQRLVDLLCVQDFSLQDCAVLIPDDPLIRRSLLRALAEAQLPLMDPRDPTVVSQEEEVKICLLPLRLIASQFEHQWVLSFLSHWQAPEFIKSKIAQEIVEQGIIRGLSGYQNVDPPFFTELQNIAHDWGGKKRAVEFFKIHMEFIKTRSLSKDWMVGFFEKIWQELCESQDQCCKNELKAPALFWLKRLEERILTAAPPASSFKIGNGLCLYRFSQKPLRTFKRVIVLGLSCEHLSIKNASQGNLWFSDTELESLSLDWNVPSASRERKERFENLAAWFQSSSECIVLDAAFNLELKAKEPLTLELKELEMMCFGFGYGELEVSDFSLKDQGVHQRFLESYHWRSPHLKRPIDLPTLVPHTISATALDAYSRCPFIALASVFWRLKDLQEPGFELWPEQKGLILHEVLKLWKSHEYHFTFAQLLKQVLHQKGMKGLWNSQRLKQLTEIRLLKILEIFEKKEAQFQQKRKTESIFLDQETLSLDFPEAQVVGRPDRVDHWKSVMEDGQIDQGWVVMDYKTRSNLPSGRESLATGYRLQLAFYALAMQKKWQLDNVEAQWIELNSSGSRRNGFFFKSSSVQKASLKKDHPWVRSNSLSLFSNPQEVWSKLEDHIRRHLQQMKQGYFSPQPNHENPQRECQRCFYAAACGAKRVGL